MALSLWCSKSQKLHLKNLTADTLSRNHDLFFLSNKIIHRRCCEQFNVGPILCNQLSLQKEACIMDKRLVTAWDINIKGIQFGPSFQEHRKFYYIWEKADISIAITMKLSHSHQIKQNKVKCQNLVLSHLSLASDCLNTSVLCGVWSVQPTIFRESFRKLV